MSGPQRLFKGWISSKLERTAHREGPAPRLLWNPRPRSQYEGWRRRKAQKCSRCTTRQNTCEISQTPVESLQRSPHHKADGKAAFS
ncbi:hypothetical protein AV530_004662 [Patagioenas fasciata monilis]|uniref:Uncharacterized protein n=1 Tax=Patagioenas fasciata monilis TaxID=372326 RepID=A0A1V4KI07_PATFA|nr:hypothetical protein AV530_004662 [Patagioenas fasciata monilis]